MFPFEARIPIDAGLKIDHRLVLETVGPLLTASRRERIHEVVKNRCFDVAVVLEGIYDRGNVSAVMRTAEGLGFANFHVIETQEKFKEANRVTQGADKWVEARKWKSTREAVTELKRQGKRLVVTALTDRAKSITDVDFSRPSALVLGNEKDGVSAEMIEAADEVVVIPMTGFVQSFNISVAGALSLFQILRDRELRRGRNGDLTEEQQAILAAYYYLRTQDSAEDVLRQKFGAGGGGTQRA
ncbi:MAG: RNA methyltransferase [Bdellovibrionaceae bacterium]|nr:RNA methyltransferase [Pseudobdellovibrionaceae bacterium]